MKKGFTLIELLAVIVILAIIALIATPIILNIINDSREQSRNRSAEAVEYAVETAYATSILKRTVNNPLTIQDILNNTKVENELTRDSSSITTKDGVKCTITGDESTGFIVTCIDTKSSNRQILSKNVQDGTSLTGFTGTIYRNTEDEIAVGESIVAGEPRSGWCAIHPEWGDSCDSGYIWNDQFTCEYLNPDCTCSQGTSESRGLPSGYETSASDIKGSVYLKHIIVNDIVRESYACFRYDTDKEACVRGEDRSFYGTYTDMSSTTVSSVAGLNPTGNIAVIESMRPYFVSAGGYCNFNSSSSSCDEILIDFGSDSDGYAYAKDNNDNWICGVYIGGSECIAGK